MFTPVHLEEYESETRDTKQGLENPREIPNVGEECLKDLDEMGIIRISAEVRDILVGKVTPKGEKDLSLSVLHAIFGDHREVRDTSLRVPHGADVSFVMLKSLRANGDELQSGVNKLVRVYITQKRKIKVGDKMRSRKQRGCLSYRSCRRHALPSDGTQSISLNPLGYHRMNIGQVMELHLGMAAHSWYPHPQHQSLTEQVLKTFGTLSKKQVWTVVLRQFFTMDVQVSHSITVCQLVSCA